MLARCLAVATMNQLAQQMGVYLQNKRRANLQISNFLFFRFDVKQVHKLFDHKLGQLSMN